MYLFCALQLRIARILHAVSLTSTRSGSRSKMVYMPKERFPVSKHPAILTETNWHGGTAPNYNDCDKGDDDGFTR
jgi:hypothetical protein